METNPNQPENGAVDLETLPPVDVPQSDWPEHSLLARAQLNELGDSLEWPDATFEQLPLLREISLVVDEGVLCARMARQFNFDRFVTTATIESGPAQPACHVPDRQRFYTRVTDNGFHVVGVFSAATIAGRRRYFQWLTGSWVEVGLSGFLYVRDDLDTHFSEVSRAQLDETQPGATITPLTSEEEWTVESVQSQFVGDPIVEPVREVTVAAATSMFEPVVEPLTAEAFPVITPQDPLTLPEQLAPPAPTSPAALPAQIPAAEAVSKPEPESSAEPEPKPEPESPAEPPATEVAMPGAVGSNAIQRSIAMALATVAHRNSVDRFGASTIDHVARVAESFDPDSDPIKHCAAWLHDVLECSDLTERDLSEAGILPEIVEIVVLLTQRDDDSHDAWLAAIAANPDARAVKLSSLDDNSAPWRLRKLDAVNRAEVLRSHAAARAALA